MSNLNLWPILKLRISQEKYTNLQKNLEYLWKDALMMSFQKIILHIYNNIYYDFSSFCKLQKTMGIKQAPKNVAAEHIKYKHNLIVIHCISKSLNITKS